MSKLTILEKDDIKSKIYTIRGEKVILDSDLAILYDVENKALNQQVKRNIELFSGYVFKLEKEEVDYLRSQNVTANISAKSRVSPRVFTEQGTLLLASVLKSKQAVKITRYIVTTFIELRKEIVASPSYTLLKEKLISMEARLSSIEDSQKIENMMTSTKVIKLSQEVQSMTKILDSFQEESIILKRPENGEIFG